MADEANGLATPPSESQTWIPTYLLHEVFIPTLIRQNQQADVGQAAAQHVGIC